MKLRLQADADFNQRIVSGLLLRAPGLTLRTASESALHGKSDPEVLATCADSGRTLLTHDQKTMPHHFGAFIMHRASPGVILVPQEMPIGRAVSLLHEIWETSDRSDWVDRICRIG